MCSKEVEEKIGISSSQVPREKYYHFIHSRKYSLAPPEDQQVKHESAREMYYKYIHTRKNRDGGEQIRRVKSTLQKSVVEPRDVLNRLKTELDDAEKLVQKANEIFERGRIVLKKSQEREERLNRKIELTKEKEKLCSESLERMLESKKKINEELAALRESYKQQRIEEESYSYIRKAVNYFLSYFY